MGKLDGRVAIVTGAARGQGEAEARLLASEGASVVVADILDGQAHKVADDLGARGLAAHLDVANADDWARVVHEATERFGRLDILVNNAGIFRAGTIEDMPIETFMQVFQVNQLGCWLGMKHAAPAMRKAGGGSMINIASQAALTPAANVGAYAGTKGAVRAMSRTAAAEFAAYGIRVNSVYPGAIDTDMSFTRTLPQEARAKAYAHLPIPRVGTAEEVAKMVLFLASDDSSYCTGAEFLIDGGALATFRVPTPPAEPRS